MPAPEPNADAQLDVLYKQLQTCSDDIQKQMTVLMKFNQKKQELKRNGKTLSQKDELQVKQHIAYLNTLKARNEDLLQQYNAIQTIRDKSEVLDTTRDTVKILASVTKQTKRKLATVGGARHIVSIMEDTANTMDDITRVTNAVSRAMSPYGFEEVLETGEAPVPLTAEEELDALFADDTDIPSQSQSETPSVASSSVPVDTTPVLAAATMN